MMEFRLLLENGLVNLVVIVGFLIFSIGLIPMILWMSAARSAKANSGTSRQSGPSASGAAKAPAAGS